jgi:hypothetical protein
MRAAFDDANEPASIVSREEEEEEKEEGRIASNVGNVLSAANSH